MTHFKLTQIKKPTLKALLMTPVLCLFLSFKPVPSLATGSFVSPTPNYIIPQVKGDSTNDNPGSVDFANLSYSLAGLVFGAGAVSGIVVYKRKNQKKPEEINFVDA